MDHERERILDQTQHEFESEVVPLQSNVVKNEQEIEDKKDEIRRIKMRFEALREDVVRDAEVVENRVKDDIGYEQMRNVDQLEQYINQVQSEASELRIQTEDVERKLGSMKEKFKRESHRLQKMLEEFVAENSSQSLSLMTQVDEAQRLTEQKLNLQSQLEAMFEFIKVEKEGMSLRLDELESQYIEKQNEHKEQLKKLSDHLETGSERMDKLNHAIGEFDIQIQAALEQQERTITNLESGIQEVISQGQSIICE